MRRGNKIRIIFDAAIGVLATTLGVALGLVVISKTWESVDPNRIPAYILLSFLLLWLVGWFVWDILETRTDPGWLGSVSGPATNLEILGGIVLGVLIAIVFSVMIVLIGNVPFVILIFSLIVLGCSAGDYMVISGLRRETTKSGNELLPELNRYYLERPHMVIHCIQLTLCVIAAVVYALSTQRFPNYRFFLSYGTLVISILINETILWVWRIIRIRALDARERGEPL